MTPEARRGFGGPGVIRLYLRFADFRAGRRAGFFPAALRAAGRLADVFLAGDFLTAFLAAAGRFLALAAARFTGRTAFFLAAARLAGLLRAAGRLLPAERLR